MADVQFKVIEQAPEIADGDYILTIHDGNIVKVAKSDANVGGSVLGYFVSGGRLWKNDSLVTQNEFLQDFNKSKIIVQDSSYTVTASGFYMSGPNPTAVLTGYAGTVYKQAIMLP